MGGFGICTTSSEGCILVVLIANPDFCVVNSLYTWQQILDLVYEQEEYE